MEEMKTSPQSNFPLNDPDRFPGIQELTKLVEETQKVLAVSNHVQLVASGYMPCAQNATSSI